MPSQNVKEKFSIPDADSIPKPAFNIPIFSIPSADSIPRSAFSIPIFWKISGARKEPAAITPPNKSKRKYANKIKVTGERQPEAVNRK